MVVGGQAVLLYGEPRLTRDVDVTLGADPRRLGDVLAICERLGLTTPPDAAAFVAETLVLPCTETATGLGVGFIFSYEGYERAAIERTVTVSVGGAPVRFASVSVLMDYAHPRRAPHARPTMRRGAHCRGGSPSRPMFGLGEHQRSTPISRQSALSASRASASETPRSPAATASCCAAGRAATTASSGRSKSSGVMAE